MKKVIVSFFALAALGSLTQAAPGSILERLQRSSSLRDAALEAVRDALPAPRNANHAPFKAVSTAAEGPTLYGWIAYNENWDKNQGGNYGIYSFRAAANTGFEKVWGTKNVSAAANADGKLCAYYVLNYGGAISIRYYMYDADSGELKAEKTYGSQNVTDIYTHYAYTLAYNYKDATLYGEFFRRKNDDLAVCLSRIDPLTGVPTEVVELKTGNVIFVAMAFDDNGVLHAIGDDGKLYTIDTATGNITESGSTGMSPMDSQCAYIGSDGSMYWPYLSDTQQTGLYSVDLSTAKATLVREWPGTTWMVGLYGEHTATGKVPAPVADLAVSYANPTSLDAAISFTAPAKAADGSTLSGTLNVELYVDYEKVASAPATVAPGAAYSVDRNFSAGRHKVEVILKNDAGYGDRSRVLTFAGKDKPGAPGNVSFALDGRTATVTWEAPQTGANGGWFDASALTYKVVRQPDNKVVAQAATETAFTEEIPDRLGNYFYEVTSVTTEEGATAASQRILYGTALTVPYTEAFDTEAPLDLYTMDDVNGDGYFWKWKNGAMVDVRGDAQEAADWLITPPIALTTDWIYKLKFDAHGVGSYYTEHFKAGIATKPEGSAMKELGSYTVNGEQFQSYETLVEIDAAGNYHIGIQHCTPAPNTNRDELHIDNLELVPFISTAGPASVDALAVELFPENPLKGTMEFTVPTKAMNGSALDAVTKVEIYRDGTLVDVKTDAVPGKAYKFEIDVPQGEHLFNVIAHNGAGRGHDTEISVFGGVDIPLPVTNVRYEWNPSDDNKATIRWDAPGTTGVHGLEIPSVTYNILSSMWGVMIDYATGLKDCSYELSANMTTQELVQRGIQAVSTGGKSTMEMAIVNLGPAVPLDAYESFSGGAVNYPTWNVSAISGQARWSMYNSNPEIAEAQDGDNGYAMCIAGENGGEDRLVSPAFDFSAQQPAYLHLWVFHSTNVHPAATLTIEATSNGLDYNAIGQPIRINDGSNGWKEHEIALSALAGVRKAMLGFRANVPERQSKVIMDNIVIDHTSAITGIEADLNGVITFATAAGSITISGAAGCTYSVHTPDGKTIAAGTAATGTHTLAVAPGLYIVKAAKAVAKVAVP